MDTEDNILYSKYERHFANIQDTLLSMIKEALEIIGDCKICPVITGSGGLSLSSYLDIPFVQEVVAVSTVLRKFHPTTDVAIAVSYTHLDVYKRQHLLECILKDIDFEGSEVAVMINDSGATPLMELYICLLYTS